MATSFGSLFVTAVMSSIVFSYVTPWHWFADFITLFVLMLIGTALNSFEKRRW